MAANMPANNNSYLSTFHVQLFDVFQILFADIMQSGIFSVGYHELVDLKSPILAKYAKYETRISKNIALYGHTTANDEECTVDENITGDTSRRLPRNEVFVMEDLNRNFVAFMELLANMKQHSKEIIHVDRCTK